MIDWRTRERPRDERSSWEQSRCYRQQEDEKADDKMRSVREPERCWYCQSLVLVLPSGVSTILFPKTSSSLCSRNWSVSQSSIFYGVNLCSPGPFCKPCFPSFYHPGQSSLSAPDWNEALCSRSGWIRSDDCGACTCFGWAHLFIKGL